MTNYVQEVGLAHTDLRVQKTLDSIRDAYIELLGKRGYGKVSVTELARDARIAKGTFYLHYTDINDLHRRLLVQMVGDDYARLSRCSVVLDDPAAFLREFSDILQANSADQRLIMRYLDAQDCQQEIVLDLMERIFAEGDLPRTRENEVRLFAYLNALLALLPAYADSDRDLTVDTLKTIAGSLFRYG